MNQPRVKPDLTGVPETTLWTLYHRAGEARRSDRILVDPVAVDLVQRIDYPFGRRFGPVNPAVAIRSRAFDEQVSSFLTSSPDGQVVNLGDGLETQRYRIDNGQADWLSVDLPQSMVVRERLLPAEARFRHFAGSALATEWFDEVDPDRPCCVTAQGLLMYLPEAQVRMLLQNIAARLPGALVMFDAIPGWVARLSRLGLPSALWYSPPPFAWALAEGEQHILRAWVPSIIELTTVEYQWPQWPLGTLLTAVRRRSRVRRWMPTIFKFRTRPTA